MNKNLLINSKRAICLYLLSSGILFSGNVLAQDTTGRAKPKADSTKKANAPVSETSRPAEVPVLYGTQPRSRVVQSTSYLNGKKLESAPVTLVSNALGGQLAGLYTTQSNGAPRYDNPTLSLRGKTPLIVIDGVPRYNLVNLDNTVINSGLNSQTLYDVLSINPEQIESVTLLKDALSTVMLGNRAMNGVLMINTRNKGVGNNAYVTVTAQAGVQTPIGLRKGLSSYDYAALYNEAAVNSGFSPVYSQAQLEAYRTGSNPLSYPNTDFRSAVLRKNAPVQRYNVSAGGNYSNIRYFLSLDYQAQVGLLNEPADSTELTNVDYRRYIIRSNIDIKIDKHLSASFNLLGNIQDFNQPGRGYAAVFNGLLNTPNNASPLYNANNTIAGSQLYPTNPYAQSVSTGHLSNNLQAGYADISLKRDMGDVVKGTWLKALLSYNPSYEQQIDRSRNYNAYYFGEGATTGLRVNTISEGRNNASNVIERFQQTYLELSAGIDRNWKKNAFTGLLMANLDNSQSDFTLNQVYRTLSGRINYSFDNRYNLEFAGAYSGNNRFAEGNRYDFYPAVGVSWNISNEDFMKGSFFDELKLRASYGKVGNANPGYYSFYQSYASGSAYFFGTGATSTGTVYQSTIANPNRVTEKAKKLNVGLDMAYSNNRGWFSVDYFDNRQYDLLQQRGGSTSVIGLIYPDENIGKNRYYGFEFTTGWADKVGKLNYSLSGNFSTVGSKVMFADELPVAYPYLSQVGYSINQIRGYVFDGLFSSANLNAPTLSGYTPSVGDAKYKDLNNDGVINQYDQTVIGNNKPLLYYGANLSLQYAGFDMNLLVQGVANRDILVTGNYEYPFNGANGRGQAFEYNLNRYTPATASTATLPRVLLGTDVNNYIASSLFVRNASYLRLKNAEIGFSFSTRFLTSAKIKKVRIFVNGQNLLTSSKYKESDPENYTGLYPIQRIVNGGIAVKL